MSSVKILGLFLTKGISVKLWKESGLLDREKLIYEELLKEGVFDKIYWFSYGWNDKIYENELKNGIEIIEMPAFFKFPSGKLIYSFLLPFFQRKFLKECIIYKTNQIWGSWTAVFAKWMYKKKLFVRTGYTLSLFNSLKKRRIAYIKSVCIERLAYNNSDLASVSSQSDFEYIKQRYKPKQLIIIPNFIDTDVFKPLNAEKTRELIFVGRLSKQKNLFNLIKAVAQTNYTLDIYGDGELRNELLAYISELKITNQIFLRGRVANKRLPDLINQCKIYILPSFYEGMPKTLLEAMSCGAACIGTKVKGILELIENGKNGVLVEIDAESILSGIKMLMCDGNQRNSLGQKAREKVSQFFSLVSVADIEKEVYQRQMK